MYLYMKLFNLQYIPFMIALTILTVCNLLIDEIHQLIILTALTILIYILFVSYYK